MVEDGQEIDEDSRVKARERERQRAMQNLEPRMRSSSSVTVIMLTTLKLCSLTPNLTRNAKNVSQWISTKLTRRSLVA